MPSALVRLQLLALPPQQHYSTAKLTHAELCIAKLAKSNFIFTSMVMGRGKVKKLVCLHSSHHKIKVQQINAVA